MKDRQEDLATGVAGSVIAATVVAGSATYMVTEAMIEAREWTRGPGPFFRSKEVAEFFFGMSASWLRLKLKADDKHPMTWFTRDGRPMDFRRNMPGRSDSARVFTLADIEPMAWSLFGYEAITEVQLAKVLRVVEAQAFLWDLRPLPPMDGQ